MASNNRLPSAAIAGAIVIIAALLALPAAADPGPPGKGGKGGKNTLTVSAAPGALTGNELPCLPLSFTATMTNTSDHDFFADMTLSAEAPIELSTEVFSSYLPATDPDQPVSREVDVTIPPGTTPGSYDITLRAGKERTILPLTVTEVPEPGPGDNLAYGRQVTASSTHGRFSACAAVDGNSNNDDWESTGWNDGDRDVFPDSLAVSWPEPVELAEIVVYTRGVPGEPATRGIKDFDVQIRDGDSWATMCTFQDNLEARISCPFPATTTDAFRVLIHSSNHGGYSRILELEAYAPDA